MVRRNSRLAEDLFEILHASASETTTHGLDHIFKREHPFIKLFWFVCFLISAGFCSYVIALSIVSYLRYDTVTRAQQIYLTSAEFPAITICNQNAFATSTSAGFIEKLLIANKIVNESNPQDFFDHTFTDQLLAYRYFISNNVLNPKFSDTFRKSLGYQMSEMIVSCVYNLSPCTADDFYWFFDVAYGNCFVFNKG